MCRRGGGRRRPLYGRWGAGARPRPAPLPTADDPVAMLRYHAPMVLPQQQAIIQAHEPQVASPAPLGVFKTPPSPGDSTRASVLDPALSAPPVSKKRVANHARAGLGSANEVSATNEHMFENWYLKLAKENRIQRVQLSTTSCGVFCYPPKEASKIAVSTPHQFSEDIKENGEAMFAPEFDNAVNTNLMSTPTYVRAPPLLKCDDSSREKLCDPSPRQLNLLQKVNATNEHMLSGGCVDDGAAGRELVQACRPPDVKPGVCFSTGEARITPDFKLPVSRVIYTVGPVYDMDDNPEVSLNKAYENSLKLAKENGIQCLAFRAVSSGVFCYPPKEASRIVVSTSQQFSEDIKENGVVMFAQESDNAIRTNLMSTPTYVRPPPLLKCDDSSTEKLCEQSPRLQNFFLKVNATNEHMLSGGCVDGGAAGLELVQACRPPDVKPGVCCSTGEARITPDFKLPVSRVIHTVGPVYDMEDNPEASLNKAYENSLKLAKENGIQCLAFPVVSSGVFCYPPKEESRIVVSTSQKFSEDIKENGVVMFVQDSDNAISTNLMSTPTCVRPPPLVNVCFCGYKTQMPITSRKTTVLELVQSALMKLQIKACDFFLMQNGKMLDGDVILNAALAGSNIIVVPRTRGGAPRILLRAYESLDSVINSNAKRLFRRVHIKPAYLLRSITYPHAPLLTNFSQYLLKQILICVCCEGHLNDRCWKGAFKLSNFLLFNGQVIINPDVRSDKYDDHGGAADYRRLYAIFMVFIDDCSGKFPLHLGYLLRTLKNASAVERRKTEFVAFVTNHPCLLTYIERQMLYILVDKFLIKFLSPNIRTNQKSQLAQNVETRLNNSRSKWVGIVRNVGYLNQTYTYRPPTPGPVPAVPVPPVPRAYDLRLNGGLHLCRNSVTHTSENLELAEVIVSYYLEFVLTEILYILAVELSGPDGTTFIDILSNPKADKTTVSPKP